MNIPKQILVFKTDIGKICRNCSVFRTLDSHSEILQWSIDDEDIDCVLRIVTPTLTAETIIKTLKALGHQCEELT